MKNEKLKIKNTKIAAGREQYYIKIFVLAGLLMMLTAGAFAADDVPAVRSSVDRKNILIGDRIRYKLEVRAKKGVRIEFPDYKDAMIGDFEIKDSGKKRSKDIFGNNVFLNWYDVTSYSPGSRLVSPAEIRYKAKGGKDWLAVKSAGLAVNISSVIPKSLKLADIKDIKGPISPGGLNYWILSLAILLIAFLFAWFKKISRGRMPKKLPHETALEELETIRELLARTNDFKEYFIRISDCVRNYIEHMFDLKAPEMTTEEFLNSLAGSDKLSVEHKRLLKDFLAACDMVKFAKHMPRTEEIELVSSSAKKFVEETMPKEK